VKPKSHLNRNCGHLVITIYIFLFCTTYTANIKFFIQLGTKIAHAVVESKYTG